MMPPGRSSMHGYFQRYDNYADVPETLRAFVEELSVKTSKEAVTTSVSIGISTLNTVDTKEDLFNRADTALYQAKDNGRNRVEYAVEEANTQTQV